MRPLSDASARRVELPDQTRLRALDDLSSFYVSRHPPIPLLNFHSNPPDFECRTDEFRVRVERTILPALLEEPHVFLRHAFVERRQDFIFILNVEGIWQPLIDEVPCFLREDREQIFF